MPVAVDVADDPQRVFGGAPWAIRLSPIQPALNHHLLQFFDAWQPRNNFVGMRTESLRLRFPLFVCFSVQPRATKQWVLHVIYARNPVDYVKVCPGYPDCPPPYIAPLSA